MLKQLANKLKQYRLDNGFKNCLQVANKYDIRVASLYHIENGINIPSIMTIYALSYIYKLNETQVNELLELRKGVLNINE